MNAHRIIAVDFDGTIVKHAYPEIGKPIPGAIETLLELQASGVKLILWTMRDGAELKDALDHCAKHGLKFFGANENPQQNTWTKSPKAYAQIYIDDAALGCPLKQEIGDSRPWVDWAEVRKHLAELLPLRSKETIVSKERK